MNCLAINFDWQHKYLLKQLKSAKIKIFRWKFNPKKYDFNNFNDLEKIIFKEFKLKFKNIKINFSISTQDDYGAFAQAVINKKLNVNSPSMMSAKIGLDKSLQRSKKISRLLLHPKSYSTSNTKNINNFRKKFKKSILKPTTSRGTIGVFEIKNNDTQNHFDKYISSSKKAGINEKIIIEEHIEGEHYLIDINSKDIIIGKKNKNLKNKLLTDSITFFEFNKKSNNKKINNLIKAAKYICKKLKFNIEFPCTVELIIKKNGKIYFIEAANRGAGVFISDLIFQKLTGCNTNKKMIFNLMNNYQNLTNDNLKIPKIKLIYLPIFNKRPVLKRNKIIEKFKKLNLCLVDYHIWQKKDKKQIKLNLGNGVFLKSGICIFSFKNNISKNLEKKIIKIFNG